jgi:hypothetical protein
MLFGIPFIADWKKIGEQRQQLADLKNRNTTIRVWAGMIKLTLVLFE